MVADLYDPSATQVGFYSRGDTAWVLASSGYGTPEFVRTYTIRTDGQPGFSEKGTQQEIGLAAQVPATTEHYAYVPASNGRLVRVDTDGNMENIWALHDPVDYGRYERLAVYSTVDGQPYLYDTQDSGYVYEITDEVGALLTQADARMIPYGQSIPQQVRYCLRLRWRQTISPTVPVRIKWLLRMARIGSSPAQRTPCRSNT